MQEQKIVHLSANTSIDSITDLLRQVRDRQIQQLMSEDGLMNFLEAHFNTIAINSVKTEFLRRDLKQLVNEPLDLAYYSSLITQIKNGVHHEILNGHPLFLQELLTLFAKYGFIKPYTS